MTDIDNYFEKIGNDEAAELERIRKIIKAVTPECEEVIDYGMPAFKYKGKYLMGFCVFKHHMSLFPTPGPINSMRSKLGCFKLSKGSIQFTLDNIIPESIIRKLVLYRIDEIDKDSY